MTAPLLTIDALGKRFGGFVALQGIALQVAPGERLGLIGPNGSGKTTLINCISGALRNDAGAIHFRGEEVTGLPAYARTRLGIARSFQIPRPFGTMTLVDNLRVPLEYVAHRGSLDKSGLRDEAREILRDFGLASRENELPGVLSQVELRKLELARAVAARPRLLISDEAMAGLSSAEVDEMLGILFRLNESGLTIIMIEHIMRAIMRFSQRVVCLDAGQVIAVGRPEEMVQDPNVKRAYLGA